jgi:hypothetical protein
LASAGLLTTSTALGAVQFWSSAPSDELRQLLARLGFPDVEIRRLSA